MRTPKSHLTAEWTLVKKNGTYQKRYATSKGKEETTRLEEDHTHNIIKSNTPQVGYPQTEEQLRHKSSPMGVRVLSPMAGPRAKVSGIWRRHFQNIWLWRPLGFNCRSSIKDTGRKILHSWKVYTENKIQRNKPMQKTCALKTMTLMKESKDDTNRCKDSLCSWIGRINTVKMTQSNLQRVNAISIKLPMAFFKALHIFLNLYINTKGPKMPKGSQEKQKWRNKALWLQTILYAYSYQNSMVQAPKQKYTSTKLARKPKNKPTHLWSINLWKRRQEYTVEKR